MKKEVNSLFFVFGLILISGFISAEFETGNPSHSITNQYGPSHYINGWINISLDNEPSNSVFKDSLENSISLIDLINANQDFEHTCSTLNCNPDYSAINKENTKTFNLENRESKIIGLKFTENIVSINSVNFAVESDVSSSCYNQIKIDFLDDGIIDKGNNKSLEYSTSCSFLRNYGCFDSSETTTIGAVSSTPYCQRVRLSESPGFKLGAWVKDSKDLVMALYDIYGDSIEGANCELPENTGEGEISCNINYLITESKDYYVCIYSEGGTEESKIRGYSSADGCGFQGAPTDNKLENTAYQIFAEGTKFAAVGTLEITNSLAYGNTLENKISGYILDKYGSLDCSDIECIVPIKLISGKSQAITIKNLLIKYDTVGFSGAEENNFYELTEIPATINSDFQKLYLDQGNFSVPDDFGNYTFLLSLNDEEIFSEKVTVEKVPIIKSLTPTATASAFPTEFKVTVDSSGNITKYEWDFGDNHSKTTTSNKIIYTYNSIGTYKLKVSVTDLDKYISYKIFEVLVESPEALIDTTLDKKLEDLTKVNEQIKKFDLFSQESLNSVLDINELENKLIEIQKDYHKVNPENLNSEEQYNKIMTELLELQIPESVSVSQGADSIPFYPDKNNINLDILQLIGSGHYDAENKNKYLDAILTWNQNNLETKINFKEFTVKYESSNVPILKIFDVQINGKNGEGKFYFVLFNLENLEFKEDYEEREEEEYHYIELDKSKTIIFSTTEDIEFSELPAFISPDINKLMVSNSEEEHDEGISKKIILILIIFLVVILGFVGYIILQEWYKKKYEGHLFKNKNSLYNLITYIENAKRRGIKSGVMRERLKKAGWSSEQIRYVTRKYSGKRTGMFEINIRKILEKFKKNKIKNPKNINSQIHQKF